MNYEEKYNNALERAKKLYEQGTITESIGYIFPELKESKNEKIRKDIIILVNDWWDRVATDNISSREEMLAWLEKQGESDKSILCKKDIAHIDSLLKRLEGLCRNEFERTRFAISEDEEWLKSLRKKIFTLFSKFEQRKQEGDMVEPKFHECDFIIANDSSHIYQVMDVKRGIYVIKDLTDDVEYHIGIEEAHKSGRLWTIKDAKPGDVLYCESCGIVYIIILKHINNYKTLDSYCRYNNIDGFAIDVPKVMDIRDNPKPATKEQRDTLERAITNAGYRWDSEKKELKKIEQKFKVGNWYQCIKDVFGKGITFDKNTAYYCAKEGCLQNEYGCHIAIDKDSYDNFKLWTIKDVKDGDVISDGEIIVIFKHFEDPSYRQRIVAYIGLDTSGDIQITDFTWYLCIDKVKPATKEERDTLFAEMREAGYEWDEKNKELKKIETKGDKE